ncbi:helix-turn-helix domain-containing protein [Anaerosalibacter bizertensis]|uniref:helix-turn-helix domain-containing protein n=1 Tax=Anaerosalibacter bizertensis TaxID=932217 RepID=UPI001C0F10D0|nr:helix-turn-helix domain-containing protein [Anaerosalibacter bizertensis]MBU5292787.1 helix-turn-helix domain-containing protein [Anaerosalibacter bizertensis]
MSIFGKRLKELREEYNEVAVEKLTGAKLGEALGVSKQSVSKWENGLSYPDFDTIIKLSEIFNVSTDYLLGRTDIKNPSDEISNAVEDDPELIEFWNELKEREDLQLLFKQTKNLSPKDIKQIIRIIKAIEDEEDMIDQ